MATVRSEAKSTWPGYVAAETMTNIVGNIEGNIVGEYYHLIVMETLLFLLAEFLDCYYK